jgi:hypothetical protein
MSISSISGESAIFPIILAQKAQSLAQTSAGSLTLPSNAIIRDIFIQNTTANAITGGLKFGSTAGATDIVLALAVGANALTFVADAALLKRYFSATVAQTIFFDAVSLWNSANVNITMIFDQL